MGNMTINIQISIELTVKELIFRYIITVISDFELCETGDVTKYISRSFAICTKQKQEQ